MLKCVIKKTQKWKSQIVEAVKQSSNFSGFEIFTPNSFENTLKAVEHFDLKIVASLQPQTKNIASIFKMLNSAPKKIAILIGPEGDMSSEEYAMANQMQFQPATLGKNVLKSETASLTAIAQILACSDFIR